MAQALARHHIATFRYDYPYSHKLQDGYTQDFIDPLELLLATTRAAIQAAQDLAPHLPLFLAGRSMSGQVMSLLLARKSMPHVRGLICYVYPNRWHALLPDTLAHLPHVPVPMLFIQGARDPDYCDLPELQTVLNQLRPPPAIPARSLPRTRSGAGTQRHKRSQPTPPTRTPNPTSPRPSPLPPPVIPASSAGTQHHAQSQRTPPTRTPNPAGAPSPPLTPLPSPLSPSSLYLIPDADHAFQLPPNAPQTQQDPILQATTTTATWIRHKLKPPEGAPPHLS